MRNPSVLGTFELDRVVDGTWDGQRIEYVPLDSRLKLPAGTLLQPLYLLLDWVHSLAQEMPFARASATLAPKVGFKQSVHGLERTDRQVAEAVPAFWEALPVPPAEEEGGLLVITAHGKGVPRRQSPRPPAASWRSRPPAPKPGGKNMALLGAVYTVDPFPRTLRQLLRLGGGRPLPPQEQRAGLCPRPAPPPSPDYHRHRGATQRGHRARLRGERLETLERICGYVTSNAHRLVYDAYLANGNPSPPASSKGPAATRTA
jgi:hypothetical protein